MRKILIILFSTVSLLIFSGCGEGQIVANKDYSKPIIILPDQETTYNINGYKDLDNKNLTESNSSENSGDNSSTTQSVYKYRGNKNSKKYHKPDCRYAKSLKEENLVIFETELEAEIAGYIQCSVCFK